MFGMSPVELIAIAVIGLLVFGPDKLPKLAADAARLLREIRRMASGAQQDLKDSLGPELADLDLDSLNPRTFVKRNLLDPIDDEVADVRKAVTGDSTESGPGAKKPDFDADTT